MHFAALELPLSEARARLYGWDGIDDTLLTAVLFHALEIPSCASPALDPTSLFLL